MGIAKGRLIRRGYVGKFFWKFKRVKVQGLVSYCGYFCERKEEVGYGVWRGLELFFVEFG